MLLTRKIPACGLNFNRGVTQQSRLADSAGATEPEGNSQTPATRLWWW